MKYEMNLGTLGASTPASGGTSNAFRIAVLGDFSGRANRGCLETGDALANRKPMRVDFENIDEIIARLNIKLLLPVEGEDGAVEVELKCMDDFHPDELYQKLEMFGKLSALRKMLADDATFSKAAQVVKSWPTFEDKPIARRSARGAAVPVNGKLSDFARLTGRPSVESAVALPVNDLVKRAVAAHIVPEQDPQQAELVAVVDQALSESMRRVLHHPDFQYVESLWRSVELLTRRLETDVNLQIVLYDLTAEEFAADLSGTDDLQTSGLYRLLVEQPALDQQQGPLSVVVGQYVFEQTPPHAELLGRMAKLAASMQAPFVAGVGNECIKIKKPEEVHPLVTETWNALKQLPESVYLGLTAPRFMLRWPYGKRTEPIESFEFEEFTNQSGLKGMLWANPSVLPGLLLGTMYSQQGLKSMKLGSILTLDDIPFYYYVDQYGDQVALPSTDRLLPERLAAHLTSQHIMPVLSIQGRPEVRLGSMISLAGSEIAGPWLEKSPVAASAGVPAPAVSGEAAPLGSPEDVGSPASEPSEAPSADDPADSELDALLSSLDDTPTQSETAAEPAEASALAADPAETESESDSELDDLLASLDADVNPEPAGEDDMDPDLASLLADL